MRLPTENMFQQQLAVLSQAYDSVNRLTLQSGSGKKLLADSDDPVLADRINMAFDYLKDIQSYSQNLIIAKNRSQLFDTSTQDAVNTTDQINQIIKRAANDTLSDADRAALGQQIKGYLNILLNDANAKDGNGEYIFGGYNTGSMPYTLSNGTYTYQGGMNSTSINIGTNVSTLYNESGYNVFSNILNGNGTFTINSASANTGTASTTSGSVTNPAAYVRDTYTLTFVTNSSGQLAYQVVGATSGQVIPAPPATTPDDAPVYTPDASISFNGMNIPFTGNPNVGDTFTIAPSQNENVFNGLNDLINMLNTPIDNDPVKKANFHQALSQSSAQFTTAFNQFVNYHNGVGVNMQVIENQVSINTTLIGNERAIYGLLSDVNMEEAVTSLGQQTLLLQATQECYKLIQSAFMQILKGF